MATAGVPPGCIAYSAALPTSNNDSGSESGWTVRPLDDDRVILSLLEEDRLWAAYAIGDLDPPFRDHAHFIGAVHGDRLRAILVVYEAPGFATIVPCGDEAAVWHGFAVAAGLPGQIMLSLREPDMASLQQRYRVEQHWAMLRMAVRANALRPVAGGTSRPVRLDDPDIEDLEALYGHYPGAVFGRDMLSNGVYYGVRNAGRLVAVAGTHVVSTRHRIAAIGGVYTLPDYRDQGLATATTSAVAERLRAMGVADVVLNVREDNLPAIAVYRRLGFETHMRFLEGVATLR